MRVSTQSRKFSRLSITTPHSYQQAVQANTIHKRQRTTSKTLVHNSGHNTVNSKQNGVSKKKKKKVKNKQFSRFAFDLSLTDEIIFKEQKNKLNIGKKKTLHSVAPRQSDTYNVPVVEFARTPSE